jgi:hypothetical protein
MKSELRLIGITSIIIIVLILGVIKKTFNVNNTIFIGVFIFSSLLLVSTVIKHIVNLFKNKV